MHRTIGYILQDGTIFNLLDNGFRSHWLYELHLTRSGELEKSDVKYSKRLTDINQWIRINDGSNIRGENIVQLPIKGITEKQRETLLKFLDDMMYANKLFVDVGIEEIFHGLKFSEKAVWYQRFDFSEYLPDDIMKEISRAYNKME